MKIYAIKDKKNGMIYSTFREYANAEKFLMDKAEKKPWVFDFLEIAEVEQ